MAEPLRVLFVEDNADDALLLALALTREGYAPDWHCVDDEAGYLAAIERRPEIILSDFEMPQFNGLRALELLNERGLEIPFIIVSGTIGEELAVAAMKRGASDYLLKGSLARLGPSVRQALEQFRLRRDQRQSSAALRESEERFREVVENIQEVLWLTEADSGRLLYLSPGYERIWQRPRCDLIAGPLPWRDHVHPEDRERVLASAIARQTTGGYDETYRIVLPDRSERWIRDRAFPVEGANGLPVRIVGVAEDVTENRKLEERLLRAQRMEAIGTLASGLAHDLNNILAPMLLAPGIMKSQVSDPQQVQFLEMIESAAQRGAGIVRQLLAFSRGLGGKRAPVQAVTIVKEVLAIAKETFPRDIEIRGTWSRQAWKIVADAIQIHQVLMNLCVNARDAMAEGGRLEVAVENATLGERDLGLSPQAKCGPYVVMTVADTGCGIPEENLPRVFDPFFTTKDIGKGTGLGLASVHGIVSSHGGFVLLESKLGQGTRFRVYLPAVPDAVEQAAAAPAPALARGMLEVILLVDDEAPVRTATRRLLEQQGYRVIEASNGEEGVNLYVQHQSEVRLVLTDIMMPVMGGLTLIKTLRAIEPKVPILAFSGLDPADRRDELRQLGVDTILLKPVESRELLQAVQDVLSPAIARA